MSHDKPIRHRHNSAGFAASLNTPRTIRRSNSDRPKPNWVNRLIWVGVAVLVITGLFWLGNRDRHKTQPLQPEPPGLWAIKISPEEAKAIDAYNRNKAEMHK